MYESGEKASKPATATQPMSIQLPTETESDSPDQTEIIQNPERGCGYMEDGKAYLKADMAVGGGLPAFVVFEQAIPFKENRKRSYTRFPGIQFELSVTGESGMTETDPKGEVWSHLNRLAQDRPTGETAGEMVEFHSQDLLLSVGKTHYPDVDDFVDEARVHGVSKAISVTSGNTPPEINPGRTRLFLIHPHAIGVDKEIETTVGEMQDDDMILSIDGETVTDDDIADPGDDVPVTVQRQLQVPGVFGYTYLSRVVYTEDTDGNVPSYIKDYEATGDLDLVRTGREQPYSEQEGFNGDGELTEDAEETMAAHYGGNLDTEAVMAGLAEAEDEIREFAESNSTEPVAALEAPSIEKMEKAPFGELAGEGPFSADAPPAGEDKLRDADDDGALAVLPYDDQHFKVMPTHILSVDEDAGTATTQVGPYKVKVTNTHDKTRTLTVTKTR